MSDRKFSLIKLGPGDYLCPSNDAKWLYRISVYFDGSAYGLEVSYEERAFWRVRRVALLQDGHVDYFDLDELSWGEYATGYETRRAAMADIDWGDQP